MCSHSQIYYTFRLATAVQLVHTVSHVLCSLEFQIAPSNRTIARGSPVTFHCQVTASSSISISWQHNGITVISNNRTQQDVLPNGTLQLTIDPTMDGDDGNYSCVATVTSTQEEHIRTAYLQFACKPSAAYTKCTYSHYSSLLCSYLLTVHLQ